VIFFQTVKPICVLLTYVHKIMTQIHSLHVLSPQLFESAEIKFGISSL